MQPHSSADALYSDGYVFLPAFRPQADLAPAVDALEEMFPTPAGSTTKRTHAAPVTCRASTTTSRPRRVTTRSATPTRTSPPPPAARPEQPRWSTCTTSSSPASSRSWPAPWLSPEALADLGVELDPVALTLALGISSIQLAEMTIRLIAQTDTDVYLTGDELVVELADTPQGFHLTSLVAALGPVLNEASTFRVVDHGTDRTLTGPTTPFLDKPQTEFAKQLRVINLSLDSHLNGAPSMTPEQVRVWASDWAINAVTAGDAEAMLQLRDLTRLAQQIQDLELETATRRCRRWVSRQEGDLELVERPSATGGSTDRTGKPPSPTCHQDDRLRPAHGFGRPLAAAALLRGRSVSILGAETTPLLTARFTNDDPGQLPTMSAIVIKRRWLCRISPEG